MVPNNIENVKKVKERCKWKSDCIYTRLHNYVIVDVIDMVMGWCNLSGPLPTDVLHMNADICTKILALEEFCFRDIDITFVICQFMWIPIDDEIDQLLNFLLKTS